MREDMSLVQGYTTLLHERAHRARPHRQSGEVQDLPRALQVGAKSVAYLGCTELGLHAEQYSLPRVALWVDGDVDVIRTTADRLMDCHTFGPEQVTHRKSCRLSRPRAHATVTPATPRTSDSEELAVRSTVCDCDHSTCRDTGRGDHADRAVAASSP